MPNPKSLSLILIGNELISGEISDTNGRYLLEKLRSTNVKACSIRIIGDDASQIASAIREALSESDMIITSGGLGPTSDDITVASIADFLSLKMLPDEESVSRLKKKYESRGRPLNPNSFKQTLFPEGSVILPNEKGTADSCIMQTEWEGKPKAIACLPGVPLEFQTYVDKSLWDWVQKFLEIQNINNSLYLRIFGLSESYVGSVIDQNAIIPADVQIAYRPQFPELLLCLKSSVKGLPELETLRNKLTEHLGSSYIIGLNDEEKLPITLAALLKQNCLKLALAESCTGGRLSAELTKIPGISDNFYGSVVSYSNEMKTNFLEIPHELIGRVGAVSEECALAMADSISARTGADIGISITGIAGPGGETPEKPVGTIFIGLVSKSERRVFRFDMPWDRERNQIYASWQAMDIARRCIMKLPLEWPVR